MLMVITRISGKYISHHAQYYYLGEGEFKSDGICGTII